MVICYFIKMRFFLFVIIMMILSGFFFSACNTARYLSADDLLLSKNNIKIESDTLIRNKQNLKYELSTLYKQKPNTNFLFFFPREWFFFSTQDSKDTTKFDQWQRRVIAEVPAFFSPLLADSTQNAMRYYLQYNGYYDAEVYWDDAVREKKKQVEITYFVYPKMPYLIDTTLFISGDSNIHQLLQRIQDKTVLKKGEPLTRNAYESEKKRVTDYLRNNGYARFYANFIAPVEADTSRTAHTANVLFEVLPPAKDSLHQVFSVGNVTVYPNYNPTEEAAILIDTLINGYYFKSSANTFKVNPQTIINGIYLRKGNLYSQENYDKTIKQLSTLSIYKFVRIKEEVDPSDPGILNFRIELTRNPKMEFGVDFELNYTNRSTSSATSAANNLIGISISPSLRNRNLLGGAELLVTNVSAGVEINPDLFSDTRFWNTIDFRIQSSLYFPKFIDYFGVWKGLNSARINKKGGIISNNFYDALRDNTATRLSASYNYLLLLDFYRYDLLNASFGYDVQKSNTTRYIIDHIGIDYLLPETRPAFDEILDANGFLQRSFSQQLFVSLLFRNLSYVHSSRPNRFGESSYWGFNVEMAGAEIWAGNAIYNAFSLKSDTLRIGNTSFSQYIKLEQDFRYFKQYTPKRSFAARINFGIARPFGYTTDVPYVKQFYVGGPNSIRAWAVRGLGPGGYVDSLTLDFRGNNRLLFYQAGDLKLEFNVEYRFNIFWRLNGALFLDGGNVWTIRREADREGSQFLFKSRTIEGSKNRYTVNDAFYKQIALGGGLGLRFDFTYFIFRLDMGTKLRYPYPYKFENDADSKGRYWNDFQGWGIRQINFNLGLGYPF